MIFMPKPLFTINLVSADIEIFPDALAGLAASAALTVSDILSKVPCRKYVWQESRPVRCKSHCHPA
jgi:hypothetical protein